MNRKKNSQNSREKVTVHTNTDLQEQMSSAFNKHIMDVERLKHEQMLKNQKTRELNVLTHHATIYDNREILFQTLNEIEGNVLIVTGEGGLYALFMFIEDHLELDLSKITLVTNKNFDVRSDKSVPHDNGGITTSYEYHIYKFN